jgi:hypothetical protein
MKSSLVLTLSAISLLTACSGGGDGFNEDANGNNGGNVPGPGGSNGETVAITANNAVAVTRVSYQAALSSGALAGFTSGTGLVSTAPGGVSKIDGSLATSNKIGNSTASVPIPETTEECPQGGSTTLSGEIADPLTPTLTPGDSFDIFFSMCDDGLSVVDGGLFYEVVAFSGDILTSLYSLTMAATFTDFQVATAEDELVSNGDLTVRIDTRQFPSLETEVSGNSLTIDGNVASVAMTDFSSVFAQDTGVSPSPYTQSSSGTIDSSLLSGVVSYATTVDFEGFDADYPDTGVFVIYGSNSSARLTAIDNVNVRVEIDADGDSVYEETFETSWVELEAL